MVRQRDEGLSLSEVQTLLDLAEELRRGGQLDGARLANAAGQDLAMLRKAVASARHKQEKYEDLGRTSGSPYQDKNRSLATTWRNNADAFTQAVSLVLDQKPQSNTAGRNAEPVAIQIVVACELLVHTVAETWTGHLQLAAIPPVGSTINIDGWTKLTVTDIEMDLSGRFTIHTEPPPAGASPSRAALTKAGLTVGSNRRDNLQQSETRES